MASDKFALLGCVVLLVTSTGCPGSATGGVAVRPDGSPGPQACPEKAREAMNYLRMFVGEAAWAQLDANQTRARPITLYDGNIESVLEENIGLLEAPARLYGRVWTGGPQVVIRYYAAQPVKGGAPVPICAVARLGFGQLRKHPESKPGTAILDSPRAGAYIVDEFR
ncbi:hypothetical protein [Myxococcus xanthus]|uniref:Serine/threonine protein kinase n=1 Tax=Myxococcus xanthus TaxID=34 RepID=A0AAE6G1S3_MYXXA|nr:hypothetical protein [Myxococcus xanthus]QDE69319.1 hypothetical protein BHS09_21350 [Myxococcus xanthus]QDE76596.1 hypothetical protein BHS08_21365 [Myxococcus xanthus]QDE84014.1 hypothetical protein BHS07_22000 [Myxococcus xanthus]QDE98164.1 hypothetical protein BHS05_21250 [Myxococcus xanthus]QDF05875.1 hypothetical protein BHS04_22090 [Myxococcus xanthus]